MAMAHTLCAIDRFDVGPDGAGGESLRLEGWHLGAAPLRSLVLVLDHADAPESRIEIEECHLPDAGVLVAHGREFGEAAGQARFRLAIPAPAGPPVAARLLVILADGLEMEYRLDPPGVAAQEPGASAEAAGLAARFQPCDPGGGLGRLRRWCGIEDAARPDAAPGAYGLAGWIERRPGRDPDDPGALLEALDREAAVLAFEAPAAGRSGQIGMERLYEAFRSSGRATLLWVTAPVPGRPAGTVARLRTRLLHGAVAGLGTEQPAPRERESWLAMLGAAAAVLDPAAG